VKVKGKIVELRKVWSGKIEDMAMHVYVLNGKVSEVIVDGYRLKKWERNPETLRQIADHIDAAIEASEGEVPKHSIAEAMEMLAEIAGPYYADVGDVEEYIAGIRGEGSDG